MLGNSACEPQVDDPLPDNIIEFPKPTRHVVPETTHIECPEIFSKCLVIHMGDHTKEAVDAPFGRQPTLPWWPIVCAVGIGAGAAAIIISLI